jgi:hypothetical protein
VECKGHHAVYDHSRGVMRLKIKPGSIVLQALGL